MDRDSSTSTRASLIARLTLVPADPDAWREFVDRYGPVMLGWCRQWKLQEADAQDVTQAALQRMFQRMPDFVYDRGRSFRGWLHTVTKNVWTDIVLRRKSPLTGASPAAEKLFANLEAGEDLCKKIGEAFDLELWETAQANVRERFEAPTWQAFVLTEVQGEKAAAAARRLDMSVAAVYTVRLRVRKALQEEVRRLEVPEARVEV